MTCKLPLRLKMTSDYQYKFLSDSLTLNLPCKGCYLLLQYFSFLREFNYIGFFDPWVKNFSRSSMKTAGMDFRSLWPYQKTKSKCPLNGGGEGEVFLPWLMVLSIEIVKLSKSNLIPFQTASWHFRIAKGAEPIKILASHWLFTKWKWQHSQTATVLPPLIMISLLHEPITIINY